MLGIERLGHRVLPISVRRPSHPARDQNSIAGRVCYLYDESGWLLVLQGLIGLPSWGLGALRACHWLAADILRCGPHRLATWKLLFQFFAAVKLARLLRIEGCAHLHVHFAHVPAQIAMYASAMSGVPFTIMAHANDIFERGLLLPEKAERAVKMLTISDFNRAYLEGAGVPSGKLAVVRCGVSFAAQPPAQPFVNKLFYRSGTLGRLVEKKGVDDLIRAVAELCDKPYKVELSIAGDGPLRAELEQLARRLGICDRVRFEGSLGHDEVAAWMRGLDVFVLACKRDSNGDMDGIPVVLMEAMSQSVPVVSTRLSGIPELVLHGKTGMLADPSDAKDLAEQLDHLLSDPELRKRVARAAAGHVQQEFGQQVNLERLLSHFSLDTHR